LELTQNKSDIKILIKDIYSLGDPDDIVIKEGIGKFKNIPEISNFKYYLNNFKSKGEDDQEKYKKALFEVIVSNKDAIIREKMLKIFTQETGILKTILVEEIEKYEKTKGLISDVGIGEVLKEETSLLQSIEAFEERAWRCGKLKGVSVGFPIFDVCLDGLQTGLVLALSCNLCCFFCC